MDRQNAGKMTDLTDTNRDNIGTNEVTMTYCMANSRGGIQLFEEFWIPLFYWFDPMGQHF